MSNSLAKNSIFNVCYQLLNVIFPLISASYVARVLMPSGVYVKLRMRGIRKLGQREYLQSSSQSMQSPLLLRRLHTVP